MLRLATRSSKLAVVQCEGVAELLRAAGFEAELVLIDPAEERQRPEADDKGRFTRGVERALLEGRADIGVHSAKDLPGEVPDGLVLAGAAPRGTVSDAWITNASLRNGALDGADSAPLGLRARLAELPPRARVGTASLRRRSQLLALRSDLAVEELRGNVDTRLRLLEERQLDAIVLATAGLERLGRRDVIACEAEPEAMLPAPGQGTLALEIRAGGTAEAGAAEARVAEAPGAEARAAVEAINCPRTFAALQAERAVSAGLKADCDTPIGALARIVEGDRLLLEGYVGRADGSDWIRDRLKGPLGDPVSLGSELAERMIAAGAMAVLDRQ